MSFGFSVGDFLAAAVLIKDVIIALRGSAGFEYTELELELHGLNRALHEVELLYAAPDQEPAVNAVKAAALMCQYPLEEFARKLEKYTVLRKEEQHGKLDLVKSWGKKVTWSFSMDEEVMRLRAYLAAHVGSLNMRLVTLGIGMASVSARRTEASNRALEGQLLASSEVVLGLKTDLAARAVVTENIAAQTKSLFGLMTVDVIPQLRSLVDLAGKIWSSNMLIMTMLTRLYTASSPIDTQHTWFQPPLRFEDAFGRLLPVPTEYGWSKLESIIMDQFCRGPGYQKVCAGEYEIFNTNDSTQRISKDNFDQVAAGTSLTMAVVIGRYDKIPWDQCPRPDCRSKTFDAKQAGGKVCTACKTWFGPSRTVLQSPFTMLSAEDLTRGAFEDNSKKGKRNRSRKSQEPVCTATDIFKQIRDERKWFKNMRIHTTQMSEAMTLTEKLMASGLDEAPSRKRVTLGPTREQVDNVYQRLMGNTQLVETPATEPRCGTASTSYSEKFMAIVAEECECEVSVFSETTNWDELCLDSLLTLRVMGRARDDLGLDLPAAFFVDNPRIADLVPALDHYSIIVNGAARYRENKQYPSPQGSMGVLDVSDWEANSSAILHVLCDEMGCELGDLDGHTSWDDIGFDSLINLVLVSRVNEVLGIELPETFFYDHSCPDELENYFKGSGAVGAATAEVVLVSGSPRHDAKRYIFIMPDEGGSEVMYRNLRLAKLLDKTDEVAYAIEWPYRNNEQQERPSIADIAKSCVDSMKRFAPRGPFCVAGWSMGGVIAFEVCQLLARSGQDAESLILLDVPVLLYAEPMPSSYHNWAGNSLLQQFYRGGRSLYGEPYGQKNLHYAEHAAAIFDAAFDYGFRGVDKKSSPKTLLICASEQVDLPAEFELTHPYLLFLERQLPMPLPNLWSKFIPRSKMQTVAVQGCHYSMLLKAERALDVGRAITDFLHAD